MKKKLEQANGKRERELPFNFYESILWHLSLEREKSIKFEISKREFFLRCHSDGGAGRWYGVLAKARRE